MQSGDFLPQAAPRSHDRLPRKLGHCLRNCPIRIVTRERRKFGCILRRRGIPGAAETAVGRARVRASCCRESTVVTPSACILQACMRGYASVVASAPWRMTMSARRAAHSGRMTHISFTSLVFRGLHRVLSAAARVPTDTGAVRECVHAQHARPCERRRDATPATLSNRLET